MKKLSYLLCLSGFLAAFMMMLPAGHSQEKSRLAVFEFQAIGVDEITAQVSWQLLHTELVNTNKFRVIEIEEISRILGPEAICYDVQCASELGRQLQADKVVIGSLSRLGMKIVVNLRMVNVAQAAVEFEDRLISEQEEDLDIVMKRLALGLATGKKAEDTAAVGAITEQETREPRRRATFYTSGLKIGFLWPQRDSYGEAKKLTAVDFTTWYETPTFVVEALTGFRGGDGAYDFP
ncbi:MAG: CsgG/HfaB family protein, partial [candidate division KSB1 bacterium]|nr:CsgG/HfaB family protein [candidate division KSB1 bacterium]